MLIRKEDSEFVADIICEYSLRKILDRGERIVMINIKVCIARYPSFPIIAVKLIVHSKLEISITRNKLLLYLNLLNCSE